MRIAAQEAQRAQAPQANLPATRLPVVDSAIEAVVLKALAKDPADRYASAGELGSEVEHYLAGQPTMARPIAPPRTQPHRPRWRRASLPSAIAALSLALLGICWGIFRWIDTDAPSTQPTSNADEAPGAGLPDSKEAAKSFDTQADQEPRQPKTPQAGQPPPIDLLSLASVPEDAVHGTWTRSPAGLKAIGLPATLSLHWKPQGEYDFRVSFTRLIGNGYIGQILSYKGRDFVWLYSCREVRGIAQHGLQFVNGNRAAGNVSTVRNGPAITNGKRHTSIIQVRKASITVYLDDRLVTRFQTDYSNLSLNDEPAARSGCLGIAAWRAPVIFHSAEVIPVDDPN
jgi:hypothetical protein